MMAGIVRVRHRNSRSGPNCPIHIANISIIPVQPGAPAEPEDFTALRQSVPELSSVENPEDYESQADVQTATRATAGPTGWDAAHIPTGPEEPAFGTDPVSADATALSSTLNQSSATGVPRSPRQQLGPERLSGNVGPNMVGDGRGATDETGPSDRTAQGLDLGGGTGTGGGGGEDDVAKTTSKTPEKAEDNPVEEPTADGAHGDDGEQYTQVPPPEGNNVHSKEALRGPSAPPAREEYEFEKAMDGKKPANAKSGASFSFPSFALAWSKYAELILILEARNAAKSNQQDQTRKPNAMSKMKERFSRAGNHFHHNNKT